MVRLLASFSLCATALLFASFAIADAPVEAPQQDTARGKLQTQLAATWQTRHAAALQEYDVRIAEFLTGRSPANAVIQSNTRLLHASLMIGEADAAADYDRRAARIESIAKRHLELRTGTIRELEQAKAARLDAILKAHLERTAR